MAVLGLAFVLGVLALCILILAVIFQLTRTGRRARGARRGGALPLALRGLGCLLLVALGVIVCIRGNVRPWHHWASGWRGPPPIHMGRSPRYQRSPTDAVVAAAPKASPRDSGRSDSASSPSDQAPLISFEDVESEASEASEASEGSGASELAGSKLALESPNKVQIDFEARPEWVDQPDQDVGQVHQISIASGPFLRLRHARKELYEKLKAATDAYINEVVGHPRAAEWVGYEEDEVRRRFVASDHYFDEKVVSPSFGPMQQSHALLEFGPEFHREIEQAWHNVMARAQLIKVALGSAAVLGALVLLLGYFKTDAATGGSYRGRLKFVTILAILTVVAAGFVIAGSIPGLWL